MWKGAVGPLPATVHAATAARYRTLACNCNRTRHSNLACTCYPTHRGSRSRNTSKQQPGSSYLPMSFWMRSMASTVASASPKAVRRT